jgi:cell division protein FtsI/penicillin-binding protein 2
VSKNSQLRWITSIVCVIFVIVAGRLVAQAAFPDKKLLALAETQHYTERDTLPRRGTIYFQDFDANQLVTVAESVDRYSISATPEFVDKPEQFAAALAPLVGTEPAALLKGFTNGTKYMAPFGRNLTLEQVQGLVTAINAVNRAASPSYKEYTLNLDARQGAAIFFTNGFFFKKEYGRFYPEGALAGQVLGYVDANGNGQYGFEGQFQQQLAGSVGKQRFERDSGGRLLNEVAELPGSDGTSYELTIDRNVQRFAENALAEVVKNAEAKAGNVLVMDTKTGAIIAMASTPSYDPNSYNEAAKNDITVFDNPAISRQWEPGSIMKPIVMALGLETGTVTPSTTNTFAASVTVEDYTISTALNKAYGLESMTDVMVNSDNVAMVWLADLLGNQRMGEGLSAFGFGKRTGIDLRNEIPGTFSAWNKWRNINRATISFGQGVAVTPLQILTAYAAFGNGGVLPKPHVTKAIVTESGETQDISYAQGERVMSEKTARDILSMLEEVVVRKHPRAGATGYKVGGKTGTAQVANLDGPGYKEGAYTHSFAGIAPLDNPRFAILTKIDEPNTEKVSTFAEGTAVPLFGQVVRYLLHYYQVTPTGL